MRWVIPRTDAPISYVSWTALYTISVVCERNFIAFFDGWQVTPNLYLILVGPPGMRKTTVMENFSSELLEKVVISPELVRGPDFFTKERMFEIMETVKSAVYLIVGEFSDLLQKNKEEIYEFLITAYDSKKRLSEGTRLRKDRYIENPCLNMMAATTPGWIQAKMSQGVVSGGFASRCLWVFEESLRESKLFTDRNQDEDHYTQMEADLITDLAHISTLRGIFRFCRGAEENAKFPETAAYGDRNDEPWLEAWYAAIKKEQASQAENDHIRLYRVRKHAQIIKISMIHSVSQRDDLVILREDMEFAIRAITSIEPKLLKVFGGIGRNEYAPDMMAITGWVLYIWQTENRATVDHEIRTKFISVAHPRLLDELIRGCILTNYIQEATNSDGVKFYSPSIKLLTEANTEETPLKLTESC